MIGFVKPLMLSGFAVGSLAVAGQDAPPAPPAPPVPPAAVAPVGGAVTVTRDGNRMVVGQSGGFGGGFGSFAGPADVYYARSPFGDEPKLKELAKKLVDSKDDEQKEKLRSDLKAALAKSFDERQKGQEKQVEELEKQLKRLKETITKRREAKAEIIADRMTALEKDAKGLGW